MNNIILLFTRYPQPGQSKTRLIPALGAKGAAHLQKKMTEKILSTLHKLQEKNSFTLEVHYDGGNIALMRKWLGDSYHFHKQPNRSLGNRMEEAILPHLPSQIGILLVGSDCPDISVEILQDALQSLSTHEVVLGPTFDGGYYLIGVTAHLTPQHLHLLFKDISWSTETVFAETLKRIIKNNLTYRLIKKLHDIDTPEDLRYIDHHTDIK